MSGVPHSAVGGWRDDLRLRFLAVGAWNTVFGYGCYALLFLVLGPHLHYLWIQVVAHFVSVSQAFVLHRRYTFRSSAPWLPEFLRFNASYLGTLGGGLLAQWLLVGGLGVHPLLGAALVTGVTVVLSYGLHRYYSFGANGRVP